VIRSVRSPGSTSKLVVALVAVAVCLAASAASAVAAPAAAWDPRLLPLVTEVEDLRGLTFEHPVRVEYLSEADFEQRVAVDRGKLTETDRAELARSEAQLRALGLVPAGVDLLDAADDVQQSGVLAYYDPVKGRITVRGEQLDVPTRVTLAHELTHALQDEHFDLRALQKAARRAHGSSALQALIEGDAKRIEGEYIDGLSSGDQARYSRWQARTGSDVQGELDDKRVPGAVIAIFQSPYLLGPQMLRLVEEARGEGAIDDLFRDPPDADLSYLDPVSLLEDSTPVDVATPALGDGEMQFGEPDVFGAFALYLMLATSGDPIAALRVADGWGGDAMVTFTRGDTTCLRAAFVGRSSKASEALRAALDSWAAGPAGTSATVTGDGGTSVLTACDPGAATVDPGDAPERALVAAAFRNTLLADGAEQIGVKASSCTVGRALDDPTFAPVLAAAVANPSEAPDDTDLQPFLRRFLEISIDCATR
jgi:hypothetical protein